MFSRSMIAGPSDSTPSIAGRPDLPAGRTTMTFYPGMSHLTENTVLNVKNRSHSITAEIEIPEGGANGVIIAQGGPFCGLVLVCQRRRGQICP